MNYQRLHDAIIADSRLTSPIGFEHKNKTMGYKEKHHIIPKCIGGTNNPENLIFLTARRHFMVHRLLTKIHPDNAKIWYAFRMMFLTHSKLCRNSIRDSKLYEHCKAKCNMLQTGIKLSNSHKENISLARRGLKLIERRYQHTIEMRDQISRTVKVKYGTYTRYTIIDRFGKTYQFENIRRFCVENQLDRRNLGRLLKGIFKTYKGYRLLKSELEPFTSSHCSI